MQRLRLAVALLTVSIASCSLVLAGNDGVQVFRRYLDMLASGNLETAETMWTEQAQERSSRFGIEYIGIPLRIDCASPIVRNLDLMINHLAPPVKKYEILPGGAYSKLEFANVVNDQPVQHFYYLKKDVDWYWLTYSQDYYAESWPVRESDYLRVHIHPDRERYVHRALLEEADRLVEKLAKTLDLPRPSLQLIREKKIEFFYCSSDEDVKQITGARTRGTLDLPSSDIISASFPHLHELAHLLVNIKLKRLPLYTLPVLQEGVAVCCGGRWGKNAGALMDLGVFLYREKLVELDSILTMDGFEEHTGADIAYPLVGVFSSYLIDELGHKKFFQLYLSLSGNRDSLAGMTPERIQAVIAAAAGKDGWGALIEDFDRYTEEGPDRRATAAPGKLGRGKTILSEKHVTVRENSDWLAFEFWMPGGGPVRGNFLFEPDERLTGEKSIMFEEQYGDDYPFEGYRFSVLFDENEAGLYDYATDRLLAKYIWGISPSEEYFDADSHTIAIRFRKSLLGKHLPRKDSYKLITD